SGQRTCTTRALVGTACNGDAHAAILRLGSTDASAFAAVPPTAAMAAARIAAGGVTGPAADTGPLYRARTSRLTASTGRTSNGRNYCRTVDSGEGYAGTQASSVPRPRCDRPALRHRDPPLK